MDVTNEKKVLNTKLIAFTLLIVFVVVGMLMNKSSANKDTISSTDTAAYMDLASTLAAENIKADLSSYTESNKKINIYMFRGHGCSHCLEFLEFLASIVPDYGKYFNLVSFEVWYNSANAKIMNEVSSYLKIDASGVPFIIIGEKTYVGYASSDNDEIKTVITDLYNSKTHYDVFEKINETNSSSESK